MKLRLSLLLFCLLGIGVFSHSQDSKKTPPPPPVKPAKPTVLIGDDAIPVTVKSSKKGHWKVPPPPPKVQAVRFKPPKIVKDIEKAPPPPPAKTKAPIKPDAPPKDQRA